MKKARLLYLELMERAQELDEPLPCENAPDAFFIDELDPNRNYKLSLARKLCGECPLSMLCLDYALEANEEHGIWAGTTPLQRFEMKKGRLVA